MAAEEDNDGPNLQELGVFEGLEDISYGAIQGELSRSLDLDHWLLIGRFLWPPLREYRGGVFIDFDFQPKTADEWLSKNHSIEEVERLMNHVHVWDLISDQEVESRHKTAREVAQLIAKIWQCRIEQASLPKEMSTVVQESNYGPVVLLETATGSSSTPVDDGPT